MPNCWHLDCEHSLVSWIFPIENNIKCNENCHNCYDICQIKLYGSQSDKISLDSHLFRIYRVAYKNFYSGYTSESQLHGNRLARPTFNTHQHHTQAQNRHAHIHQLINNMDDGTEHVRHLHHFVMRRFDSKSFSSATRWSSKTYFYCKSNSKKKNQFNFVCNLYYQILSSEIIFYNQKT